MRERYLEPAAPAAFLVFVAVTLGAAGSAACAQDRQRGTPVTQCTPSGSLVQVEGLPELSGLAPSRRTPGRLWSHNDSGEPMLFALDAKGRVTGRVRVDGADVDDWEAVATGPCGSGSCVYVGDIGDNDARRAHITVYRVDEPEAASGSVQVRDAFDATYPDGAHDAETLLVDRAGRLYIVTKDKARTAIYRFPAEPSAGATMTLERVGAPRDGADGSTDRITDGAVSADGAWVVLRGNDALTFYRAEDLFAGRWREARRVALKTLGEPQGEAVAFGAEGVLYLAGEGGGGSRPGTFAQMSCPAP